MKKLFTTILILSSIYGFSQQRCGTSIRTNHLLENNEDFAINLRRVQSLGYIGVGKNAKIKKSDIQDPSYFRHGSLGWNYRMPELCAAVALAQTERIEELVDLSISLSHNIKLS